MRDGAALTNRLNDTSKQLNTALSDADAILKAVDPKKVAGVVDSVSEVATTISQNRGNIDQTIKNATEMTAKLNESGRQGRWASGERADFLGSPGTQGRRDRLGDAAQSVKKLADDVDGGSRRSRSASTGSAIQACANMRRSPFRGSASSKTSTRRSAPSSRIPVRSFGGQAVVAGLSRRSVKYGDEWGAFVSASYDNGGRDRAALRSPPVPAGRR